MAVMTERKWARLIAAFRDQPGNFTNAAREAGITKETARKAWEAGYPKQNRKPIQQLMAMEANEREALARARADAVRTETEAFAAALRGEVRNHALEEYERTNQYLRAAAMTATSTLVAAHRLQPVVQELGALAPRLVESIHMEVTKGEVPAAQAMKLLEQIANFTKTVAAAANAATLQGAKVVEVSRARSGDMGKMREAVVHEPFDANEAKRLAAELAEAAIEVEESAAQGPALAVLDGGAAVG